MRKLVVVANAVLAIGASFAIACSSDSTPAGGSAGSPSTTTAGGSAGTSGGAGGSSGSHAKVSLITKEAGNPFFAKMIEGAQAEATLKGATVTPTTATTNAEQVTAITDA